MIRIWIDDAGVIRLEARGQLEAGAMLRAHDRFYEEEWDAFVAADRHLADYRGVDLTAVEASTIRALASRNVEISKQRPPLRIAVLVDPGAGYGLARMWEQHADKTGWPLKVFIDEGEAWRWLSDPGRFGGPQPE